MAEACCAGHFDLTRRFEVLQLIVVFHKFKLLFVVENARKRQGQSLEQSTNSARAGKVGKKKELHNKTSQYLKRLSPEPRPSTSSAVDPMPVASARKIKFFKAKETVEESSDEDSEPGPSKKPKTKVAEEKEEFEDMQRSDMTIVVDLSCLQLLITASGVLCPLCEQSVSIMSFLLSLCVYWVGRGGGGVFVSLFGGVCVRVFGGVSVFFTFLLFVFFFFGGGGVHVCACVHACVCE